MRKGFTLVELLAVIAILAILVLIATPLVTKYIMQASETSKSKTLRNVEDAALVYAMEHSNNSMFIPNDCATSDDNPNNLNSNCKKNVMVSELIDKGFYKDDAKRLKRDGIITIYKYKSTNGVKVNYDLKAYVPESIYN